MSHKFDSPVIKLPIKIVFEKIPENQHFHKVDVWRHVRQSCDRPWSLEDRRSKIRIVDIDKHADLYVELKHVLLYLVFYTVHQSNGLLQNLFQKIFWEISDIIPKKSKILEFGKNCLS